MCANKRKMELKKRANIKETVWKETCWSGVSMYEEWESTADK